MYVVVSGEASVRIGGRQGTILERLAPGDLFGEIALLSGMPRTADVVAETDIELVVVDRARFFSYVEKHPTVAITLLRIVAERLAMSSIRLAERRSSRAFLPEDGPSSHEFVSAGPHSSRQFLAAAPVTAAIDPHGVAHDERR
jgi:CRP-like cAMP-binding protein